MNKLSNIEILLSDARGIFIPRDFFQGFDLEKWHLKNKSLSFFRFATKKDMLVTIVFNIEISNF